MDGDLTFTQRTISGHEDRFNSKHQLLVVVHANFPRSISGHFGVDVHTDPERTALTCCPPD